MNALFGVAFIPYLLALGILIYMLILLANFLKAGRRAFEVYVENNEQK